MKIPVVVTSVFFSVVASLAVLNLFEAQEKSSQLQGASVETSLERVMRTGVLRCGYALWPPAVVKDPNTGEITGIIPDIMAHATKGLGLKLEYVQESSWGTFVEDLRNNRFDAMCAGAWEVKEVVPHVSFTNPIFFNSVFAYVKIDEQRINADLSNLNNLSFSIGCMDGAQNDTIAQEDFPQAKKMCMPQTTQPAEVMMALAQGKFDVVFMESSFGVDYINRNPGKVKRLSNIPYKAFASPLLAVDIRDGSLIPMFNTVISEMYLQGTLQKIINKYQTDPSQFIPIATPYKLID